MSDCKAHSYRFKWAQLALQLIVDPEGDDDADEIQELWATIKPQPNQGLLQQLIIMYDKVYLKHLPTIDIKRRAAERKAEKLLKWSFCSTRPLKSSEISSINSENLNTGILVASSQSSIPKSCRSFVFLSEFQEIEISHSSVRDYLALKFSDRLEVYQNGSDQDRDWILREAHCDSLLQCNIRVSIDCLSCLLSTNKSPITAESSPPPPLVQYAAENWVNHVTKTISAGSITDAVLQPLLNLFTKDHQQALQNWLFLCNPEFQFHRSFYQEVTLTVNPEPLYYAILVDLWPLIEKIFARGIDDVNAIGGLYGSCLQLAGFLGKAEVVQELISRGAKVDAPGGIFGSVLQAAVAGGHCETVSLLFSNPSVDPNIISGLFGIQQYSMCHQ